MTSLKGKLDSGQAKQLAGFVWATAAQPGLLGHDPRQAHRGRISQHRP